MFLSLVEVMSIETGMASRCRKQVSSIKRLIWLITGLLENRAALALEILRRSRACSEARKSPMLTDGYI